MNAYTEALQWIAQEKRPMLELLREWAEINSGSENLLGLSEMLHALTRHFSQLGGSLTHIPLEPRTVINDDGRLVTLPHGKALSIIKRPEAKLKVLLCGHLDTVYSEKHSFQKTSLLNDNTLQGPGVADMKGGLVILLKTLEALEKHPLSAHIGWEVLINPDEEIGSIGSYPLFVQAAKRNTFGLIFEPALADGALVSSRKGSANVTIVVRGKAAHAGRDFDQGRSAIAALATFIVAAQRLNNLDKGISLNIGHITGGGPVNIVPDLSMCRLNIRTVNPGDFKVVEKQLHEIAHHLQQDGIFVEVHTQHERAPKVFDQHHKSLFEQLNACAKEQGYELSLRPSGGACDGNILAQEGLPTLDSLGVIGNHIHTKDELMHIDSLTTRTSLVTSFLLTLAAQHIEKKQT